LFFGGLALLFLTIALGGHTPVYRLWYEILPGTKRFRAPSLSFFVVALSLVTMAALTLERLAALRVGASSHNRRREAPAAEFGSIAWVVGGMVLLSVLGAALAGGEPTPPGAPGRAQGWIRFGFFAAAVGGVLWGWVHGRMRSAAAALGLAALTLADLWIIDRRFIHTVDEPEVTFAADDVVSFLRAQPGTTRVWNFPYPQPYRSGGPYGGNYPMLYGIEQAGGEHPNPLQRWNEYLGAGTRTYIDWHNWIVEAAIVDTAEGQAIAFRGRDGFLNAANIRYVISMAPLANPALREVHRGTALIYENTEALPRAYLVPEVEPASPQGAIEQMARAGWDPRRTAFVAGEPPRLARTPLEGDAAILEHTPDHVRIQVRASRPALLVLADNDYEGWHVRIGGNPAQPLRVNHTFRGVVVPAGASEVVWEFRPASLRLGFWIYLAGFGILGLYGVWLLLRARSHRRSAGV
jgi:hypothetical protein